MSNNFREPQSPNEAILQNILGEQNELREPRSVTEFYLQKILEQGGGGTEVVANPELAGTESDLTGLQVGETKYKVEQPVNVVANPTLAGTEAALTGLQVGDTKYKIDAGGGHLYQHFCHTDYSGIWYVAFLIINDSPSATAINPISLISGSGDKYFPCSGYYKENDSVYSVIAITYSNTRTRLKCVKQDGTVVSKEINETYISNYQSQTVLQIC